MTSFCRNIVSLGLHRSKTFYFLTRNVSKQAPNFFVVSSRFYSSNKNQNEKKEQLDQSNVSLKQKLKNAVAQYGTTVIVFHVGISLVSLGICYLIVSSGLDVEKLMVNVGFPKETADKMVCNAGTFAIAYAIHKVFAPARIMLTLTAAPFIVRYLRQVGVLKKSIK